MPQTRIPVAEATDAQLRSYAETVLGIGFGPNPGIKRDTILRKMADAGFDDTGIWLPDDGPAPDRIQHVAEDAPGGETVIRKGNPDNSRNDPMVNLRIAEQPGAGGNRPVPVGVNGQIMLIPRNKDVDVPWRYFLAMRNAVQMIYETDPNTHELGEGREVPAHSVQVNTMPSAAEIAAWEERTQKIGTKKDRPAAAA